jgi:hypothetical protein
VWLFMLPFAAAMVGLEELRKAWAPRRARRACNLRVRSHPPRGGRGPGQGGGGGPRGSGG